MSSTTSSQPLTIALLGTGACAVAAKMFQTGLSGGPWWRFLDVALGALYLILVAAAGIFTALLIAGKRGLSFGAYSGRAMRRGLVIGVLVVIAITSVSWVTFDSPQVVVVAPLASLGITALLDVVQLAASFLIAVSVCGLLGAGTAKSGSARARESTSEKD